MINSVAVRVNAMNNNSMRLIKHLQLDPQPTRATGH